MTGQPDAVQPDAVQPDAVQPDAVQPDAVQPDAVQPDYVAMMPFAGALGVRIPRATKDEVVGHLDHAADRTTASGTLHGGAIMALADSVGAVCAVLNLPAGATTSTTSSSTVFVRAVREGTVTATARALHVGRSTIAVTTEVRDGTGRLVAQTTQTQAVLGPAATGPARPRA